MAAEPVSIVLSGCYGRMGNAVCQRIWQNKHALLRAGVDVLAEPPFALLNQFEASGTRVIKPDELELFLNGSEVYVDFTTADASLRGIKTAIGRGCNIVVGTTGYTKEQLEDIAALVEKAGVSAVISPNFSIGVNIFWHVTSIMAEMLPEADIEVIEVHHNKKVDAPSGTAARIIEVIHDVRGEDEVLHGRHGRPGPRSDEIGVHSVRLGDVIGDHTVMFGLDLERLELTHRASSREALAIGAVKAIEWVSGKNDGRVHTMGEVLGLDG